MEEMPEDPFPALTIGGAAPMFRAPGPRGTGVGPVGASLDSRADAMKVRNSLKSAKTRDKNCRVVRRRGRVYVINKRNPRFKARQG